MGKAKQNKRKRKVPAPTGLPSVRDVEREESEFCVSDPRSKKESAIQTVIENLQGNVENKILGLHSLASIFQNSESVESVVKHRIVKIAGPLLLDPSSAVRHSAAGALRNLSVHGDHDICDLLVEQDVMTPLAALIQKYAAEWPAGKKVCDEHKDTFIQAIHLLWNLCESNGTALKYFNKGQLLPILLKHLESDIFGVETAVAVAQCLHTITEDNPEAISSLQGSDTLIQKLIALEGDSASVLLLKTLATGLLLNVLYWKISNVPPTLLAYILDTLTTVIGQDQRKALNTLTSSLPLDSATTLKVDESFPVDNGLPEVECLLEAQQTAIEILANLCSSDDGDEEPMDLDSSDLSDDFLSDSSCPENEIAGEEMCPLTVPAEVHEAIVSHQLVQKIWDKTILPPVNVCGILKEHSEGKHLFKKLTTLRCRAFLCLNNIVSTLDIEDVGGPSTLYKMWLNIGNLVFKEADPEETYLLEAATSAMRAAMEKLAKVKCDLFVQLQESDIQLLINGQQQCCDPSVRANLIRILGTLGMILTSSIEERSQVILENIGKFLLDGCTRETELWVIAEALDTVMDVFGEDETDKAAANIGLVDRLEILLPILKQKVRLQKKSLGEHYLVVATVNANLTRFIKYKTERIALL